MGLGIAYTAKLATRTHVKAFLVAADRAAKARGWKRVDQGPALRSFLPHAKSEEVSFDFTRSLTCEWYAKTGYAPLRTHVEIVEFLREVEPRLKSLEVEDECEYWETGDRRLLKKHRDGFAAAVGKLKSGAADTTFAVIDVSHIDPDAKDAVEQVFETVRRARKNPRRVDGLGPALPPRSGGVQRYRQL